MYIHIICLEPWKQKSGLKFRLVGAIVHRHLDIHILYITNQFSTGNGWYSHYVTLPEKYKIDMITVELRAIKLYTADLLVSADIFLDHVLFEIAVNSHNGKKPKAVTDRESLT